MKVKICGITRKSDAIFCDQIGVDFLGFNFYRLSPRYITTEKAGEIILSLKNAKPIGVFVEQDINYIKDITEICNLSGIQIHGGESVEFCKSIRRIFPDLIIIQSLRVREKIPETISDFECDYFLFDSFDPDKPGGTGKTFDWKILPLINRFAARSFIAGGINPENVDRLLCSITPFGVDIASGVEKSPGIKDCEKIRILMEKVRKKTNEKNT